MKFSLRNIFIFSLIVFSCLFANDTAANNLSVSNLIVSKTNPFGRTALPAIARTSDQTAHMVYTESEGIAHSIYYTHSYDNGLKWRQPINIAAGFGHAKTPLLINTSYDKLIVFWEHSGSIYTTESLDKGNRWSKPFKVSGKFVEGKKPAATVSEGGDIHLVWENGGNILYRSYSKKSATWSTIYNISKSLKASTTPVISNISNKYLIVCWIEQGTVVSRQLDLSNGYWTTIEEVSKDKNQATQFNSCENLALIVDAADQAHVVWTNNKQVLHRTKVKGYWSPIITQLSSKYLKWISQPTLAADNSGKTYVAFIEDNTIIVQEFNSETMSWKIIRKMKPKTSKILFSPQLGGNYNNNDYQYSYQSGYDIAWVEKSSSGAAEAKIRFSSKANFISGSQRPKIVAVQNNNGRPYIVWDTKEQQTAFQVIINNRKTPDEPILFDSKKVPSPLANQVIENFTLQGTHYYFFVRIMNDQGLWSQWSTPYLYQTDKDIQGPTLEISSIDEDSLFMHSPDPQTLYYGIGLETPKEFVIRGNVTDSGSGIKKITFSPAFGDQPPPLKNIVGEEWAVRYTLKSTDEPGTIIITAYDNVGHATTKIVSIMKDTTAPEPPSWVKVYPDKTQVDNGTEESKIDNDRSVYVTWVNGKDTESGIRYHLMGNSEKWWQNAIHKSGDAAEGAEGENSFYVYAVDNVGNVSEAGTDRIYIDSLPPATPEIINKASSTNYFIGTCSLDTELILVNGIKDELEILPATEGATEKTWKYRHRMRDGQNDLFSFQAIDKTGNKSNPLEIRLFADKTPPKLFYAEHNAEDKILRINDKLVVSLKGEPKNKATFKIEGITQEIPMYDDGTRGDIKANDAIYTGIYYVDTELTLGKKEIVATLTDSVGNSVSKKGLSPLVIDSSKPTPIDNFENKGDLYPWKNHCIARNINKISPEENLHKIPEGNGCLHIKYDFKNQQNWAGLSSSEFLPKNLSGSKVFLEFMLKGSGSAKARLFIYLHGKKKRNIVAEINSLDKRYSMPLSNSSWQKVTIPIPNDYLDELNQVVKYSIYIFSDNEEESGDIFIDNLKTTYIISRSRYQPINSKYTNPNSNNNTTAGKPITKKIAAQTAKGGEFIDIPYVLPQIIPNPLVQNKEAIIKIKMPNKINPAMVYVNWGKINNKLFKTKLSKATPDIWKATFKVPNNLLPGEHFGHIYIRSKDNHYYKKKFVYKIISPQKSNIYDLITTVMDPHPLKANRSSFVKVLIPSHIKAKSVVVFFGENKKNVYSTNLKKNAIVKNIDYWTGTINLPGQVTAGDYTAFIYIKTIDGKFIKKRTKYSIIE